MQFNCDICSGSECPYCAGPDADYHTACIECSCVEKKRLFKEKLKSISFGTVPGGYKSAN